VLASHTSAREPATIAAVVAAFASAQVAAAAVTVRHGPPAGSSVRDPGGCRQCLALGYRDGIVARLHLLPRRRHGQLAHWSHRHQLSV
jgi:hypothetical protein